MVGIYTFSKVLIHKLQKYWKIGSYSLFCMIKSYNIQVYSEK